MANSWEDLAGFFALSFGKAAELALRLDELAGTKTTIEVEPEGFLVVIEVPRGRATGIRSHKVHEPVTFADAMGRDSSKLLVEAVVRANARARADVAAYQTRSAAGQLTGSRR